MAKYSKKPKESDMRRRHIDPAIREAGWADDLVDTEHPIILDKGEIVVYDPETGANTRLSPKQIPDYTLKFDSDKIAAFVEAKNFDEKFDHGIEQAKRYCRLLNISFAYSTNGREIIPENNYGIREYDFIEAEKQSGKEYTTRGTFPSPEELKQRLCDGGISKDDLDFYLDPHKYEPGSDKLRYYQEGAVDSALRAILSGKKKILLNLATGTGKTKIAYHITRKLWERLEPNGNHPKFLFLTDRNQLVEQAMDGAFSPLRNVSKRLKGKKTVAFDIYFSLYQSLDSNKEDPEEPTSEYELYKQYDKNFFKYIIVDECHRGAQSEGGKWREILDYFEPAIKIGMTATPKVDADSIETFEYFDHVAYVYSERDAVKDGFLAPHFLKQIELNYDVKDQGWRPDFEGQLGRNNQPLEDREYGVNDYDSSIVVKARQKAVAQKIIELLNTPPHTPYDKTILFCRDQQHANEMTQELKAVSSIKDSNYCVQITSNQKEEGKTHLKNFCNVKEKFPVIAVTSKLMTTGVDAQMCKIIILDTVVNSKTELKQIIGRGTRIYDKSDLMEKYFFTLVDFRKSTEKLTDPDWDSPVLSEEKQPKPKNSTTETEHFFRPEVEGDPSGGEVSSEKTKIYDPTQKTGYRYLEYKQYVGNMIRTLSGEIINDFKNLWVDTEKRESFIKELTDNRISFDEIRKIEKLSQEEYDLFDVFVKVAYNGNPKLRKKRAEQAKVDKSFFEKYPEKAQKVLNVFLKIYADYGYRQLGRETLQLPEFEELGGYREILTSTFNDPDAFDDALTELKLRIYK